MTHHVHPSELRSIFNVFDQDGGGIMSATELCSAMRALGYGDLTPVTSRQLIHKLFDVPISQYGIDVNEATGEKLGITFQQFVEIVSQSTLPANSAAECFEAFKLFDSSRHGLISPADLKAAGERAIRRSVPDELVFDIIRGVDLIDQDGYISWDEFRNAVARGGTGSEVGEITYPPLLKIIADLPVAPVFDEQMSASADQQDLDLEGEQENPPEDDGRGPVDEEGYEDFVPRNRIDDEEEAEGGGGGGGKSSAMGANAPALSAEYDENDFDSMTIANVPVRFYMPTTVILEQDVRHALQSGFHYDDFSNDESWKMLWDDFVQSNERFGTEFLSADKKKLTVDGYKRLLQGLGELD